MVAGFSVIGSREHCMQYILSYFCMIEPLQYAHLREIWLLMVIFMWAKPVFTREEGGQKDVVTLIHILV
jgi:hypothetical protein